MSSGMNVEQAKEYAGTMTYRQAISNVGSGKFIKYRKATMIKLRELAEMADRPQGEWIPCSERLPKKEEATYLICTETGRMCSCRWTNNMYGLGSNEWSKWGWHIMDKPQYAKVVAWMPLKPWKGEDDGEDIQSADE